MTTLPLVESTGCGCGGGCGGGTSAATDESPDVTAAALDGTPVLDARSIPHEIRHATIFGSLSAVTSGSALVLVAPHDPLPLLRQLDEREPGAFTVDYEVSGPEAWRLRLTRN